MSTLSANLIRRGGTASTIFRAYWAQASTLLSLASLYHAGKLPAPFVSIHYQKGICPKWPVALAVPTHTPQSVLIFQNFRCQSVRILSSEEESEVAYNSRQPIVRRAF